MLQRAYGCDLVDSGKGRKSKAANLLRRLDKHREEVLGFLPNFAVPFTNNQIERDLG